MKPDKIPYQEGFLYVDKEATIQSGDLYVFFNGLKDIEVRLDNNDAHGMCSCKKVVAQSLNLSLPNIPYIEDVEEDIKCPFCQGKMEVEKEYLGKQFFLTCVSDDDNCPSKNMCCDGEMGTIGNSYLTPELAIQDARKRLAQSKGRYNEADVIDIVDKWVRYQEEVGDGKSMPIEDFIQSLTQPQDIEIEIQNCEHCGGDGIYVDGDNNTSKCPACIDGKDINNTPVTYQKEGKTFLKVKQ
jgi:hypothetical protein